MKTIVLALASTLIGLASLDQATDDAWLQWSAARAEGTAKAAYAEGRVAQAEAAGDFAVMVEIDPREGSGVIPNDWSVFLQPVFAGGRSGRPVRGVAAPKLRDVVALSGVRRRNYDYDRFWVVFPARHPDGTAVLPDEAMQAELVVRIAGNEGRVRWPIPAAVKARLSAK